ncbi:MAG: hypothetical protein ACNA7V_11345 [Bacteroidales bacterium]
MKKYILLFLAGMLYLSIYSIVQAQSNLHSPYSAFGLGQLYNVNNVPNKSMGGLSLGFRDNVSVNINNPASYSGFDSTSFVFEGGLAGYSTTLKTTELNSSNFHASFSHLLFGFPVASWWRTSIGLVPYSGLGYSVFDQDYKEQIGTIRYDFSGEGGLNRFLWGNAFQPAPFISFGINSSYLFGTMDHIQRVTYPDSLYMVNTIINNTTVVNGLAFDFGLQVHRKLNDKIDLVIGGTYAPQIDLNAKRDYLMRSYSGVVSGVEVIKDTVMILDNQDGKVVLPDGYGIGFTISQQHRWLFGFDYKANNWSKYNTYGGSDSLVNSHSFHLGGKIIPDRNSPSYIQRVEYRAGGYFGKSYLDFRNENLPEFGITFGTGLPLRGTLLRRTMAMINIGFEIGEKGTLKNGLIRENYFNTYIGISVYEWWFFKRRYN